MGLVFLVRCLFDWLRPYEDRERLDDQAWRLVERYESRLENAVDPRLVRHSGH